MATGPCFTDIHTLCRDSSTNRIPDFNLYRTGPCGNNLCSTLFPRIFVPKGSSQGVWSTPDAPRATVNSAFFTAGMLTRTVLTVAVRAIATAENAKAVGSLTIAAVPSPCALLPCANPRAAGSLILVEEAENISDKR